MVAIRYISIAVIVAFLASSVEPKGVECPSSADVQSTGKMEKFIVMLKKDSSAKNHYTMMENCYKKKVKSVKPNDSDGSSAASTDKDTLVDFSVGKYLKGYSALFTESFVKNQLSKMSGVAYVEKDKKVETKYVVPRNLTRRDVDNNPTFNDDRIDQAKFPLDGKYEFPDSAGKGVNIFVVDTGIRITQNEFENRAKIGGSFCDGCNDEDENGHGTHVSSIAAGKTLGVARKANLVAVRVLDADGAGSNSGVINGLSFVLDQHTSGKSKNTVVNMSLGGGKSQAVNDAVKGLTDAGVHVAVAAGNESQDACNTSPASELSAVTVGATEKDDDTVTDFSNIGKCVDIFAPGRDIEGAGIKNDDDRAVFSGTSQATPHVAGTIALIIAKDGNKSPAAMAKELNDLSTKGVVKRLKGDNDSPDSFLRIPAP